MYAVLADLFHVLPFRLDEWYLRELMLHPVHEPPFWAAGAAALALRRIQQLHMSLVEKKKKIYAPYFYSR